MSFKRKFVFVVFSFWIVCLFAGYIFAPQITSVFRKAKTTQATQHAYAVQYAGLDTDVKKTEPFVDQIDPIKLESMMIETFADGNTAPEKTNSLTISINPFYNYCLQYDFNARIEISDPENILSFVNKQHRIKDDYTPPDLVLIANYGIKTTSTVYLRQEPAEKLKEMYDAITNAGFNISASSGWRSFARQQSALNMWTQLVGAKNANNYAALPGYSEHHLGTTVDILTSENGYTVSQGYFNTRTFKWLSENAHRFGFSLSYPQGKQSLTGYNPEGWHYRYLGVDLATELYSKGISFTEYLFKQNNYCLP